MEHHTFHPGRWTSELFRRTDRAYRFDDRDADQFDSWQRSFRSELAATLGLPTIEGSGKCDLEAKQLDSEELYGYRREKWVIQTEEGFYVPFYLLLPDAESAPYPVVCAVHGHGKNGKETYVGRFEGEEERTKIAEGERDIAVQAVRRGYAAIAPDMRGFGELSNPDDEVEGRGTCRTMQMHAQLFGRSLVGERVWDVTRLLDFVEDHSALDAGRVAITGNSGGGTVSLFSAAVEERIALSVPSAYFCSFEDAIGSIFHCECNYVPGLLQLGEMWDVAGLIAPRPFLAISGKEDPIFPIEATRRAFEHLTEIYRAADAESVCELYVGDSGHRYYMDGAWPFIQTHL